MIPVFRILIHYSTPQLFDVGPFDNRSGRTAESPLLSVREPTVPGVSLGDCKPVCPTLCSLLLSRLLSFHAGCFKILPKNSTSPFSRGLDSFKTVWFSALHAELVWLNRREGFDQIGGARLPTSRSAVILGSSRRRSLNGLFTLRTADIVLSLSTRPRFTPL